MPKWLVPWVVPLAAVIAVVATAISTLLGVGILVVMVCVLLPYLRLQYLKKHPPSAELTHKPFWRF